MEPLRKITIAQKMAAFDDRWSPKTPASVGDYAVKVVKIEGEFVWHEHADDDEAVMNTGAVVDARLTNAARRI